MKIRYIALLAAIVVTASVVGASGYRLKKEILEPLELEEYLQKSIFELPFLAHTDDELMFYLEFADELLGEMTEPGEPSVPTIQQPTEPSAPTTPQPTEPSAATDPTTVVTDPTAPTETKPTDPKPTETKPTETRPTETKPVETKPTTPQEEPTFDFPDDRVDESWFDNTLFIGDSRMQGLSLYARSGNAHYFTVQAMTFVTVFKKTLSDQDNFTNKTLEQLLCENQYDKIIVNFGLNEAGGGSYSWFCKRFEQFMEKLRAWQPEAKIILNGIMPVTREYITDSKYGGDYWRPENLRTLSEVFRSYANGTDVFYIDCTEYFADSEGYLYNSVTGDGCHPRPKYYKTWRDWMSYAFSTLGI